MSEDAQISDEEALWVDLSLYAIDPLGFVLWAFPWGVKDAELEKFDGPDGWQREVLIEIGDGLKKGYIDVQEAIRIAIASGHGIGKSGLVAWIILWAISTYEHTKGVVTANTENQLKTKTWAEVAKWHNIWIAKTLFKITATALFRVGHEKTWRIDMTPWSEANTESFAGLHNRGKRVLLIYDEASAIPDMIWEVSEGALTDKDTEIIWCCFGNPTRNTGRFKECFNRFRHRWQTKQIDSRTAKMTNKAQLDQWIEDYGEDSDFCRVRVKGQFPRAGSRQLIPEDVVSSCRKEKLDNQIEAWIDMPVVIGADPARFGDDKSVVVVRQGRIVHEVRRFRGISTQEFASRIAAIKSKYAAVQILVDGVGVGGGVVDRLRALGHEVLEVTAGGSAEDKVRFYNKRAEMWWRMSEWLASGADIPDSDEMETDLCGIEYSYTSKEQVQLEKKEDMKKRGLASPDDGDALALTFAERVVAVVEQSFEPDWEN